MLQINVWLPWFCLYALPLYLLVSGNLSRPGTSWRPPLLLPLVELSPTVDKCNKTKRRILIFFRKLLSYLNLFSVLQFSKERESKQSCTVYSKFWFAVFCVHEINSFLNFTIFFWCFLKCDFLHPSLLKYINRYTPILYIITKLTMYTIIQSNYHSF